MVGAILKQLYAGGVAGCVSRTFTAPLERFKMIVQVCVNCFNCTNCAICALNVVCRLWIVDYGLSIAIYLLVFLLSIQIPINNL